MKLIDSLVQQFAGHEHRELPWLSLVYTHRGFLPEVWKEKPTVKEVFDSAADHLQVQAAMFSRPGITKMNWDDVEASLREALGQMGIDPNQMPRTWRN